MCKKNDMLTEYIYPKKQKMAVLNDCTYKNLALILTRRIGDVELFNGTVTLEEDGLQLVLTATLLVYRSGNSPATGSGAGITDITPVWCECAVTENGAVVANEFSWKEFKNFLLAGVNCI